MAHELVVILPQNQQPDILGVRGERWQGQQGAVRVRRLRTQAWAQYAGPSGTLTCVILSLIEIWKGWRRRICETCEQNGSDSENRPLVLLQ